MQLMTKQIAEIMPPLYATEPIIAEHKEVIVKFFTPDANWTWYVYEGSPQEAPGGDWTFFGLVEGLESELGYFTLNELEAIVGPMGMKVERDINYGKASIMGNE